MFGNLSGIELIIIAGIFLLLFGSKKIPDLAKGLGKGIAQFRREFKELKEEIASPMNEIKSHNKHTT